MIVNARIVEVGSGDRPISIQVNQRVRAIINVAFIRASAGCALNPSTQSIVLVIYCWPVGNGYLRQPILFIVAECPGAQRVCLGGYVPVTVIAVRRARATRHSIEWLIRVAGAEM